MANYSLQLNLNLLGGLLSLLLHSIQSQMLADGEGLYIQYKALPSL
jgi:hypothetical protein